MSAAAGAGDPLRLARGVRAGDRRALARAITLVESSHPDHALAARRLLVDILPHTGGSLRVGITGAPGVGKSTLIEAVGLSIVERGQSVAVLAVDPTSAVSGGSVLGDKTRMGELARRSEAFIRPSPSGSVLGGIARRTRGAVLLVEGWGADVVLIETVGVGQSETAVALAADVVVLLVGPGGGDDLQGIKRGVMELADIVAVTKADGDLRAQAERTRNDYSAAAAVVGASESLPVVTCSAFDAHGIDELWAAVTRRYEALRQGSALADRRAEQAREWMWREVREGLAEAARSASPAVQHLGDLEDAVREGRLLPEAAADELIASLRRAPPPG